MLIWDSWANSKETLVDINISLLGICNDGFIVDHTGGPSFKMRVHIGGE